MSIQIRFARSTDLPEILEIYNHAILYTTAVYDYQAHTLEMRENWLAEKQSKNHPVLVAEIAGQVTGFASYGMFRNWAAYQYAMEHSVYIHPQFNNQGIATSLLKELIQQAEQNQVHTLIAGIDSQNEKSIHLHQKLGFEKTGELKEVGFKFGQWLHLTFMQLILNGPELPTEKNA